MDDAKHWDLTEVDQDKLTRNLYYCLHCSFCKGVLPSELKSARFSEVCPPGAKYKFDAYFGSGRAGFYRAVLTGEICLNESPKVADVTYACQSCGACDIICRFTSTVGQVDIQRTTELVRARCVEAGLDRPAHKAMMESLVKNGNVLGKPKADRGKWAEGLDVKHVGSATADVLFFAGCRFSYDEDLWPVLQDIVGILKESGTDVATAAAKEPCCGARCYEVGYQTLDKSAQYMAEMIKASGASTLVTACSDCYYAFKKLYPLADASLKVEVLHMSEYISRLIDEGTIALTENVPLSVTYHDPCRLGRKMFPETRYDVPRSILREIPGLRLTEMERTKDCAWCCGSGAGVLECAPELNAWTAKERVTEAMATGADALVSACSWCERNFTDAAADMGADLEVCDLAQLVRRAMAKNEANGAADVPARKCGS